MRFIIWKIIVDGLTYEDLAGRRQPRAYTVMTGLILLLLLVAGGLAGLNRYLLMVKVQATPMPLTSSTHVIEAVKDNQPTPTQQEDRSSIDCPTDSANWTFTPTYASKNYNIIQPACVYQGLEKTIAWALAVREGYSRADATQQLGFTEMPMRQLDHVTIPATAKGLAEVPVSFIPPNPDFTEWRLNSSNEAAVTYALRGCFRTSTVVGNRVETWGGEYSVICLVVEDAENTHIVYSLGGHFYSQSATPMRSFLLFGYLDDGLWVWLGTQDDPKHEITDPQTNAHERMTIATVYDSHPWDANWLMDTYHLTMQPLPENWQTMNEETERDALLLQLSASQSGITP